MVIPIGLFFLVFTGVWLWLGIRNRNGKRLLLLNIVLWLLAFGPAYFTYLTWMDRGYSENWAGIGFLFGAMPFIVIVGGMLIIEIVCAIKLDLPLRKSLVISALSLLVFLAAQGVVGFLSL